MRQAIADLFRAIADWLDPPMVVPNIDGGPKPER
jgi:hypothetical protein